MTDGGPGKATESVGLLIFNHAFAEMKFSYAVTEAVMLFLLFSVTSLLQIVLSSKKRATA
jgi:raffinose/stachyose/melibiose transport system permease protein